MPCSPLPLPPAADLATAGGKTEGKLAVTVQALVTDGRLVVVAATTLGEARRLSTRCPNPHIPPPQFSATFPIRSRSRLRRVAHEEPQFAHPYALHDLLRPCLRRLADVPPSQAGLTRASQRDSNARGAGRCNAPAHLCVFARDQFTPGSRTTRLTRPPLPLAVREYTPARSADKHLPEAHCRRLLILSPAVTSPGATFYAA
jgi:hypothetical protein